MGAVGAHERVSGEVGHASFLHARAQGAGLALMDKVMCSCVPIARQPLRPFVWGKSDTVKFFIERIF